MAGRVSAAAVLEVAAREAREGRRLTEFGAHAFAAITYNSYGMMFAWYFCDGDGGESIYLFIDRQS